MENTKKLMLSDKADLDVLYDTELHRLGSDWMKEHGLTRERFIQIFEEAKCPSLGFLMEGKPIGGMLLVGDEFHFGILPQYHGRWALLWTPAMRWLFSLRQTVYGFVDADNEKCLRFLNKAGWRCTGPVEKYNRQCIGFVMTAKEMLKRLDKERPARRADKTLRSGGRD